MNHLLPCFQKFLQLLFQPKQLRQRSIVRKYSTIDITPPFQQNHVSQFQQPMPNNYTGLKDAQIFIMPDVQAQTDSSETPGNLLINKCQSGKFVIMRGFQNVYIDTCQNSYIFVGPCHSTLFIRNCKNIKIRAIAQQLRIQNSQNITIQGIVGVKPVLQDCKLIKFYSLTCRMYEDLVWQIEKAKINIFENQIYQCYDFTPKKVPNFTNGQICESQFDAQWQARIQMNDLDWQFKNTYLPQMTSTKKSLLKKVFNQNQVKNNDKIIILMGKMQFKQFLASLNCPQLHKNFTIIQKLNTQQCIKTLKNTRAYKQKIQIMNKQKGQWYFLIGKVGNNIKTSNLTLTVVEQRYLVWKLFNIKN